MLLSEWQANYQALESQVQMENADSGSFWAGLFIARLIKQMQVRRKYKAKKAECISEFNTKQAYSKMLRDQEIEEIKKEELKEMQKKKGTKKYDRELVRRYQANNQVKFENEEENEDKDLYTPRDFENFQNAIARFKTKEKKGARNPTDLEARKKLLALKYRYNKMRGSKIARDIGRSGWWKDHREAGSSLRKIQHWIKINDIRYGLDKK